MKATITIKMKKGYLIFEREIESLSASEITSGTVVENGTWAYDKVGRISYDLLNPEEEEKEAS